jgi:quinol monooxygenase YgiN
MADFTVDQMQEMQRKLQEKYKDKWEQIGPETVLLIDSWESQEAIDIHHASPMMQTIASLREKYDLHVRVERFVSDENYSEDKDSSFIRN